MIFPKHSIDSLLSLRFPPFIIEVTILIVTASAGFYSGNYNMKIALVTLVVIYAFMNYIFEKLTVPFDYSQKDYYEYDNIPWYWKILLHDKKYSYRIDDDGGSIMNDLKLIYQKQASVIYNRILDGLTYFQADNRSIMKKTKQVVILICVCDVENVYIKKICFAIYFLGITRKNFTMCSFDEILKHVNKHVDSRQSQNTETTHIIELLCLNDIQIKLFTDLKREFNIAIIIRNYTKIREIIVDIKNVLEVENKIFETRDETLGYSNKNACLKELLVRLLDNTKNEEEIFGLVKAVLDEKKSIICNNENIDIHMRLFDNKNYPSIKKRNIINNDSSV